jgi:hypothetical protein
VLAQPCNTGVTGGPGTTVSPRTCGAPPLLPAGTSDPNWTWQFATTSTVPITVLPTVFQTVFANRFPAWMPNGNSGWITPSSQPPKPEASGQYVYHTTFMGAAPFGVRYASDNGLLALFVNGKKLPNFPLNGNTSSAFTQWTPTFPQCSPISMGLSPGLNTLDFVVLNNGNVTGFRAEFCTPIIVDFDNEFPTPPPPTPGAGGFDPNNFELVFRGDLRPYLLTAIPEPVRAFNPFPNPNPLAISFNGGNTTIKFSGGGPLSMRTAPGNGIPDIHFGLALFKDMKNTLPAGQTMVDKYWTLSDRNGVLLQRSSVPAVTINLNTTVDPPSPHPLRYVVVVVRSMFAGAPASLGYAWVQLLYDPADPTSSVNIGNFTPSPLVFHSAGYFTTADPVSVDQLNLEGLPPTDSRLKSAGIPNDQLFEPGRFVTVKLPGICDVDENGAVDRNDIAAIFKARNTPAATGDLRDADGDNMITATDARICTLKCSKARCAP